MKNTQKANEIRKPKVIFECNDYIIEQIPLNYRATIKCAVNHKHQHRGIGRESYTHPEHGLDYAKEIVEFTIREYFLSGMTPQPIMVNKVA